MVEVRPVRQDTAGNEFEGSAVVLVGGLMGCGPAVVQAFLERGAKVAIGVTPGEDFEAAQIKAQIFPGVVCLPVDIVDEAAVATFFDACERELGGLAVVVMAAAPVKTGDALEIPATRYREIIEQELFGPIVCLQEAARRLKQRGSGRIISFSSMSGKTGVHKHVAPYAASKGGLITYSRVLAAELAPFGVTVNVIATALFDVQMAGATPQRVEEASRGIPVGRVGRSEEAAHAALYLASPLGAYVTGETLNLSGGRFMD